MYTLNNVELISSQSYRDCRDNSIYRFTNNLFSFYFNQFCCMNELNSWQLAFLFIALLLSLPFLMFCSCPSCKYGILFTLQTSSPNKLDKGDAEV